MLPSVWCTIYIILLYQCYTRSGKSIASPATIRRHLHHMDHPLDLRCHPLQYVCSPFEVEGEGEFIGEVVVDMVGEVMVKMVRAVVVHLSRHCLLRYPPPPPPPHTYPSPEIFIAPQTYTSPYIPPYLERPNCMIKYTNNDQIFKLQTYDLNQGRLSNQLLISC